MKELSEGVRVGLIGAAGFVTQMTSIDLALKVIIGILTVAYLAGKIIKMCRSWHKDDE